MKMREAALVVGPGSPLVVGPGVRVIVRDDIPPGRAYMVDAATITETDPETGELKYPFSVGRIDNLG